MEVISKFVIILFLVQGTQLKMLPIDNEMCDIVREKVVREIFKVSYFTN